MLTSIGMFPVRISTGVDVLLELRKQNCSLLVIDCDTFELDGFSTVHSLLTEVRLQCTGLPVVLLSRLGVHSSNWTCATTGADAFFLMPVSEDEIRKVLQNFPEEGTISLSSEPIDKLIELTDVAGDTFFEEVIRLFIEETPKSLERMRNAAINENRVGLVYEAHQLKSNSANFGADSLARLMTEMEDHSRMEEWRRVSDSLAQAFLEFPRVRSALLKILEGHKSSRAPYVG
ncbi:MAG: Hpt domain-containing protein [Methylotenera sp.]|nr:Hpt domain-containing protein [Oligoflexia bacterium]